jgi:opacity protein-like surface antigen
MRHRAFACALAMVVSVVAFSAAPAEAQQSLSLNIGYFTPRSEASRVAGDTLVENLYASEPFSLDYRISDFNGATAGAEWLFGIGDFFEGGLGVNYYQRTVPSNYYALVNDNGSEIAQDLKLQMLPISATVRFLPAGRHGPIVPYLGAGVVAVPWRYTERGDFVTSSLDVFNWEYRDSGVAVGPVVFGGVRFPVSRNVALGGEVRYQRADATLNRTAGFQGDRIDLGGITYQFNVVFTFGDRWHGRPRPTYTGRR